MATTTPDLVILDLDLPDIDGAEIISRIRTASNVPIVILSIRRSERDKIDALDRGADDYLTKPFGAGELLARIRAALRHGLQALVEKPVFTVGGLRVDLEHRQVSVGGKPVMLTAKEYEILYQLVVHAGKLVSHDDLIRQVWGGHNAERKSSLRVVVSALRGKIETAMEQPRYILTEPGVGYRLNTMGSASGKIAPESGMSDASPY
jgi:two-component system KDP operon response regulator KdpE